MANYPVLYNQALAGFCAGVASKRLQLFATSGDEVEPADFATIVTAAGVFALACDDLIFAAAGVSAVPVNVLSLTGVSEDVPFTVVPTTHLVANAAESVPQDFVFIVKAAWEGRDLPYKADGVTPFDEVDYDPVANTVVALFLQATANFQTA